ncbi:MAG: glycerophosphodiester phosphodiesterase [Solirubrobacteraceae bacterium]
MPALIRVGHRGAPAQAPDNTLASFEAAREIGVDMIEFDVLPARGRGGELYVAHDHGALDTATSLTLTQALTHFATPPFAGIRLQLDIKRAGCERAVLDALDATGTRPRAFFSTGVRGVLARFRELAPDIPRGWTVPDIPGVGDVPGIARVYRSRLPARAQRRIRSGAVNALVPHWSLVTPALVRAVSGEGGELYVWTVDDAARIAWLAELGVTGVITNDPRLFGAIEQSPAL